MANSRYVTVSERSQQLCRGALLFAELQDATRFDRPPAQERWRVWSVAWGPDMAHRARAIQSCAFNVASCWDLYEGKSNG